MHVLGSSSQLGEELMSGSLGVGLLEEMSRKLQVIHTPCILPCVSALSPPAHYLQPRAHSHAHTHILTPFSGHSYTWFPSTTPELLPLDGSRITSTATSRS